MMLSELPQKNSKTIIIGEKYRPLLEKSLHELGLECIFLPDNPDVDPRLSGHADLSLFYDGRSDLFAAPYLNNTEFAGIFTCYDKNIHFSSVKQGNKYPDDVTLNILSAGKFFFCNERTADPAIIDFLTIIDGAIPITCRQGYARCCALYIGDNAIITSDKGIHHAANSAGFGSLLISQGHIELDGFDYGFIGGSAFAISQNEIVFTGSLDGHPDKTEIISFLGLHGCKAVYLTNHPIFDIGGAVVI